jgi:hypothetical protein
MTKYLFVLCSHNSGSTLLWKFYQTSPHVAALPGEGQWVEGVEPIMRDKPWDKTHPFDWAAIETEWNKHWDLEKSILLEKTPQNLVRAFDIEKHFPDSYFVVMVRNPYAYCEGSKRKYLKEWSYRSIAERWIEHTHMQMENIQGLKHVIGFTYEELTADSTAIAEKSLEFLPELETLDPNFTFAMYSVYGYVPRRATNFNAAQIARLSDADLAEINAVLEKQPEMMAYFNYDYERGGLKRKLVNLRVGLSTFYIKYGVRNAQRVKNRLMRILGKAENS